MSRSEPPLRPEGRLPSPPRRARGRRTHVLAAAHEVLLGPRLDRPPAALLARILSAAAKVAAHDSPRVRP